MASPAKKLMKAALLEPAKLLNDTAYSDLQFTFPEIPPEDACFNHKLSQLNTVLPASVLKNFIALDPDSAPTKCDLFMALSFVLFGDRDNCDKLRLSLATWILKNNITLEGKTTIELVRVILLPQKYDNRVSKELLLQLVSDAFKLNIIAITFHNFEHAIVQFSPLSSAPSTSAENGNKTIALCYVQGYTAIVVPSRNGVNLKEIPVTHDTERMTSSTYYGVNLVPRDSGVTVENFQPIDESKINVVETRKFGMKIRQLIPMIVPVKVYTHPADYKQVFAPYVLKYGPIPVIVSKEDWKRIKPRFKAFKTQQKCDFRKQIIKKAKGVDNIFKISTEEVTKKLQICEAMFLTSHEPKIDFNTPLSTIIKDGRVSYYAFDNYSSLVEQYRGELDPRSMKCEVYRESIPTTNKDGVTEAMSLTGTSGTSFNAHSEDVEMESVNYHLGGAPKIWYGQPRKNYHRAVSILKRLLKKGSKYDTECDNFINHKLWWPDPTIFINEGLDVFLIVQEEGVMVYTSELCLHQGFNMGFNHVFAHNVISKTWLTNYHKRSICVQGFCRNLKRGTIPVLSAEELLTILRFLDKQGFSHYFPETQEESMHESQEDVPLPDVSNDDDNELQPAPAPSSSKTPFRSKRRTKPGLKTKLAKSITIKRKSYKVNYDTKLYYKDKNGIFRCKMCAYYSKAATSDPVRKHIQRKFDGKSCEYCGKSLCEKRVWENHLIICIKGPLKNKS